MLEVNINNKNITTIINDDFSFVGKDGKTYTPQSKQRRFVECYLANGGNGAQAIIDARYKVNHKNKSGEDTGVPNRNLAKVMAYEELRKPHITSLIDTKLEEYGFNEESVERQHLFLLNQFADLKMKCKAIDMFYKLRGKYPKESREEINMNTFSLADLAHKVTRAKTNGTYDVMFGQ